MKFITDYKQLGGDENKSVNNYLSSKPIEKKNIILDYLKNGKDDGVRCSSVHDYINGGTLPETVHLFTDDEYCWDSEEIYHFENYNLELNNDFIQKVLNN